MEYGVNVSNKFSFLDEDVHDPTEILVKAKEFKKEKHAPVKKSSPQFVEPPKVSTVDASPPQSQNKPQSDDPKTQINGNRSTSGFRTTQNRRPGAQNTKAGFTPRRPVNDENQPIDGEQKEGDDRDRKTYSNRPNDNRDSTNNRRVRIADAENGPIRSVGNRQTRQEDSERGGPRFNNRGPRNYGGGPGYRRGGDRAPGFRAADGGPRSGSRDAQHNDQKKDTEESTEKAGNDGWENNSWNDDQGWGGQPNEKSDEATEQEKKADSDGSDKVVDTDTQSYQPGETEEPKEDAAAEEQEQRVRTLDEYRAEVKVDQPQFNARKAGEGGDTKVYKNLVPIKKEPGSKGSKGQHQSDDDDQHYYKEKREKMIALEVQFVDSKRSYDIGGRGRGPPALVDGGGNRSFTGGGPRSGGGGPGGGGGNFRSGAPGRGGPRNQPAGGRFNASGGGGTGFSGPPGRQGPSGGGGRGGSQQQHSSGPAFNLENEQFPALGTAP